METHSRGFTLLIAIVLTAMLLLVSVVIVNIALKQLVIAYTGQQSQHSFYSADSGIDCALYWDTKNSTGISAFATSTAGSITCNSQTVTTNSQTVSTNPTQSSRIGGGGVSNPTSIFQINFSNGCAIVQVTKSNAGTTTISSRGYNTCSGSGRRFERGITTTY